MNLDILRSEAYQENTNTRSPFGPMAMRIRESTHYQPTKLDTAHFKVTCLEIMRERAHNEGFKLLLEQIQ